MSRPMADTSKRRPRRQFTDEFKASAVRLVLDDGKTVGAAARDLDLTETALREWGWFTGLVKRQVLADDPVASSRIESSHRLSSCVPCC